MGLVTSLICQDSAIIKPLYIIGNKHYVLNYRPVSLLTSFSKLLKSVMQSRILRHLMKHNILSTEQNSVELEQN
jgi:hypothetical protein